MEDLYDIFVQLRSNGSTLKKIEILSAFKKNNELKEYFRLVSNPMIRFYQKKIPNYENNPDRNESFMWAIEQIKPLSSRGITGNKAKEHLVFILSSISENHATLIKNIIKKENKCGVGIKTVNKIWNKLVELEPYQRFRKESDKNWSYIKYPAISTNKEDGEFSDTQIRGSINNTAVITRGGHEIDFQGYLDSAFEKLYSLPDFVLMAELRIWDVDKCEYMDRQVGNGILNSNKIPDHLIEHVHFKCINVVQWDSFIEGQELSFYEKRLDLTEQIVSLIDHPSFQVVEWCWVNNKEEAVAVHEERRKRGEEGSVIYNSDLIWEVTDSGTKGAMKQKQREPIDMEITDWKPFKPNEGDWEEYDVRKNWIGSFLCESSDGLVKVWVGSLKDKYRKMDPNDFIGKITIINANELIESKDFDGYTLFLPGYDKDIFIRDDKTEADSFENICEILKAKRFMNKAKRVTKNVKKKLNEKAKVLNTSMEELDW